MKKIIYILITLMFTALIGRAQQTFWTPGVPPGSTSFSPSFRFSGTDSLANLYFSNGTKWWLAYTAAQQNLRFLRKVDSAHYVTPYYFNSHLPASLTYNGGLHRTADTVKLGGPLTEDRWISTNGHILNIGPVAIDTSGVTIQDNIGSSSELLKNELDIQNGASDFDISNNGHQIFITSAPIEFSFAPVTFDNAVTLRDTVTINRTPTDGTDAANKDYVDAAVSGLGSGTVTSFGKVDGFGIISSVANPTTTPVHTIRADTSGTALQTVLGLFPRTDGRYYTKTAADAKYALQATTINAGFGMTGGGSLASNRTLTADTSVVKSKAGFLTDYNNLSGRINAKANTSDTSLFGRKNGSADMLQKSYKGNGLLLKYSGTAGTPASGYAELSFDAVGSETITKANGNTRTFKFPHAGSEIAYFADAAVTHVADRDSVAAKYGTKPVSTIYQKGYWASLTDFTSSGFTPTVSGAGISFTGGSNTYTQTMIINGLTNNDPNVDIEVAFVIGTTGHGIGIGRKSVGANESSLVVQYDEATSQLIFTSLQGTVAIATQPAGFSVSNGDNCLLRYSQKGYVVTGTFIDLSRTASSFSYSVPLQTAGFNYPIPNTSDICLYNIGGTNTISNISVKSRSLFNPDIVFIGDSKTVGLGVFGSQFRWGNQLGALGSSEVYAGGGDKVVDMLAAQSYIINYIKPKAVLICILRNDLSGGTLSSTNKTNYQTLVTNYQNAGITVYHLLPMPETVIADQSAINTFINATYPGANIIDPSSGAVTFNTATMLAVDGIHLNNLGNTTVAANILNAAKLPLSSNANPFVPVDPIISYPTTYTTGNIPFGQGTSILTQTGGLNFASNKLGIGVTAANVAFGIDLAGSFRLSSSNATFRMQSTFGTDALMLALPTTAGNFLSDAAANDVVLANYTSGKAIRFGPGGGASVFGLISSSAYLNKPLLFNGSSSGVITVQTQAAAGTYNFNLPITVGTAGQVLTSQAGGSTAMTWSALLSKPHSIFTPTTGGTVTLVNNQYNIINPAGALLALTVTLPSSPANNDCVFIKFTQNVTTVTYSGGTVVDGITAPTAGGLTVLVYDSGTTSWY